MARSIHAPKIRIIIAVAVVSGLCLWEALAAAVASVAVASVAASVAAALAVEAQAQVGK